MKLKKTQMDNKQMFMWVMVKKHTRMDTLTSRVLLSQSVSSLFFTYTRGRQAPLGHFLSAEWNRRLTLVMGLANREHGQGVRARGQGLRVWRSYSFGPFPPVGWCDPLLWPWFLPHSPPHLLAAWPPFLPAPALDPLEQWLSDTASSRRYMAISVNNPC